MILAGGLQFQQFQKRGLRKNQASTEFEPNFYQLKIMCKIMTLTLFWDSKNYPSLWKTVCNCSKTLTKNTATLNLAMASNSAFYPLFLHQFISQGIKLIRFLVHFQNIKSLLKRKDLQFNLLKNRLFWRFVLSISNKPTTKVKSHIKMPRHHFWWSKYEKH